MNVGLRLPESVRQFFSDQKTTFDSNALKIRRVLQLASDLTGKPLSQLRILDLACGPGTYSIEAALHGARVVALDARMERMSAGIQAASDLSLNIEFLQSDVRSVSAETLGRFDVILVLGILYHLEAADALSLIRSAAAMCDTAIIDTHISLRGRASVGLDGWSYHGHYYREHRPGENASQRQSKVRSSIDNDMSFWFTRKSLTDILVRSGFTSVMECHAPIEPSKPADRVTFAARKGESINWIGSPWLNDMDQSQVEKVFRPKFKKTLSRLLGLT